MFPVRLPKVIKNVCVDQKVFLAPMDCNTTVVTDSAYVTGVDNFVDLV